MKTSDVSTSSFQPHQIENIFKAAVIDRGWPFGNDGIEPRYQFNEFDAYKQAQEALTEAGIPAAWVVYSIWQGETSAMLIEGEYTRYYDGGRTTCGPVTVRVGASYRDFSKPVTFETGYFEKDHRFTIRFYKLPVILPDGSIGEMTAPDHNGYVTIKKA